MALIVVWSTLHKRKVSGSSLSANFLVIVPNLTVKDRVSGQSRGDGLDPTGNDNLYIQFDIVPPEYTSEFQPNLLVTNWQSVPLQSKRDDWIDEDIMEEGRFVPAAVLRAMRRRAQQDPNAVIQRFLNGWRDVVVINDEAHHAYGEKRTRKGEEPEFLRWSEILTRVSKAARVPLVVDMSATPWYGSGANKPEGTLYEWLACDFSVYDAFESGLVKVVRLPDPDEKGNIYIDIWQDVKGAKTEVEYLSACKGAIATIYSSWKDSYQEWTQNFDFAQSGPGPVLLVVADNKERAKWLFDHLTKEYEFLKNPGDDDPTTWNTIQIDSGVFDADKGKEAVLREIVSTVGKKGMPGERVRAVVSVSMLTEGWDVKSVSHILGLRAFGSPLLTEQIIGRGLRRTNYDVLNQPLAERPEGYEETVDAFGIPFVGFPVQKKKRPKTGSWGNKPVWIELDEKKAKNRIRVPNVRSWAVSVTKRLSQVVAVNTLPRTVANPVARVTVRPVVGGNPEEVMNLDDFRREWPLLRSSFKLAQELFEATNPGTAADLGIGPTFDELLEVTRAYVDNRVTCPPDGDLRDIGIYKWRRQAHDTLENAIRNSSGSGTSPVPILASPEWLDSLALHRFQWTGIVADGKKSHTSKVACHTDLEKRFCDFLDAAKDVIRYFKNERFGFSVTYYENNRPRQFFPDFIVVVRQPDNSETMWLAETKGEVRSNVPLKNAAAENWCQKMNKTKFGRWRFLYAQQIPLEAAFVKGIATFQDLATDLTKSFTYEVPETELRAVAEDSPQMPEKQRPSAKPQR
jgi:type III restriction enzyme